MEKISFSHLCINSARTSFWKKKRFSLPKEVIFTYMYCMHIFSREKLTDIGLQYLPIPPPHLTVTPVGLGILSVCVRNTGLFSWQLELFKIGYRDLSSNNGVYGGSNPRPQSHESGALTTTPRRLLITYKHLELY